MSGAEGGGPSVGGAGLPPYLACLNPQQLEAVRHEGRGLLILAGAGSGKTRVITTKIAWLVRERGLEPESVLAVTFTNKAAREMRDRAAMIEGACSRAVMRTFHSFGAWFLRRNAAAAGLDQNFTIYDDDDSTTLLHGAMPQNTRQECRVMAQAIARAKDYGLEPDSPDLSAAFSDPAMRRVYAIYEERLRKTGNVDFGDLIRLPARLLREDEAIRRRVQGRFRVILVDEYQDSNVAQFELLRQLAGNYRAEGREPVGGVGSADGGPGMAYVCVVGDDDQSIYRFRGAEVRNILKFSDVFPGTDIIRLERNYRSFQSILDVAGNVVSRNVGRLGKTLVAEREGGRPPMLALLDDQDAEVAYCAKVCSSRVAAGGRWSDVAILYRTNAQSLSFEKEFARSSIPYRIVGSTRFYDREEVKDALSYLALLSNGRDEVAFKRVVNKPARGIGETSVELLLGAAASDAASGDLLEASKGASESLKGKARAGLSSFLSTVDQARSSLSAPAKDGDSLASVVERLVLSSGLVEYHRDQDEVAGTQKVSNLEELANAASLYPRSADGLTEFLEAIELDRSLASQEESGADAVTLITMHNTKGLEFPVVIATGLEQGLFPREDEEGEDLEEQRRLFYVAVTRAKDELHLTSCRWRRLHGRLFESLPSRFLSEIDPSLLRTVAGRGSRTTSGAPSGVGYPRERELPFDASRAGASARGGPGSRAGASRAAAEAGPWRAGLAVYHEDYGAGVIVKVSPTPSSGPLVVVRFESGKQAQFFPKFTKKLEPQAGEA
jgi:DNA helicase II / ATP-dependent DNA helicase PcrA